MRSLRRQRTCLARSDAASSANSKRSATPSPSTRPNQPNNPPDPTDNLSRLPPAPRRHERPCLKRRRKPGIHRTATAKLATLVVDDRRRLQRHQRATCFGATAGRPSVFPGLCAQQGRGSCALQSAVGESSASVRWPSTPLTALACSRSARCGSLVQSGEVRVAARKEVSASTTPSSSSASARRWRRSADEQPLLVPLFRSGKEVATQAEVAQAPG